MGEMYVTLYSSNCRYKNNIRTDLLESALENLNSKHIFEKLFCGKMFNNFLIYYLIRYCQINK